LINVSTQGDILVFSLLLIIFHRKIFWWLTGYRLLWVPKERVGEGQALVFHDTVEAVVVGHVVG
jgi:hypothetical protein